MNAEYNPPIKERDTKELLTIVENFEDWKQDALSQARNELVKRGYSMQKQKNRAKSKKRYQKKVSSIKAEALYSKWGLLVLFVLAPFLLVVQLSFLPTGETFLELKEDGFERKWNRDC